MKKLFLRLHRTKRQKLVHFPHLALLSGKSPLLTATAHGNGLRRAAAGVARLRLNRTTTRRMVLTLAPFSRMLTRCLRLIQPRITATFMWAITGLLSSTAIIGITAIIPVQLEQPTTATMGLQPKQEPRKPAMMLTAPGTLNCRTA